MILADTSVVIPYTRGKDTRLVNLVHAIGPGICGMAQAEVLGGARSPSDRQRFMLAFRRFMRVSTPEPVWDMVGDHRAALFMAGTPIAIPDVVIATVAIYFDCELWTRDQHFTAMQAVIPALKLYVEP